MSDAERVVESVRPYPATNLLKIIPYGTPPERMRAEVTE